MAVLIEGISVVVRCDKNLGAYQGGVAQFKRDVPNDSLRADGKLAAVTFLNPVDVETYVRTLESRGLRFKDESGALDIVVVDQRSGFCFPCSWAEFGRTEWNGESDKEVSVCAVGADLPQPVVVPDGWSFDRSLSASHRFIGEQGLPPAMRLVRREEELDVYLDDATGVEFFSRRFK